MRNHIIYIITILFAVYINQGFGQCQANGSQWEINWESCIQNANPNPQLPSSHWILYDLGDVFDISQIIVFNHNHEPEKGFNESGIHFSNDRLVWIEAWTGTVSMADGQENYQGFSIDQFNLEEARYILVTATSNHGHASCTGISEIQITAYERGVITSTESIGDDLHNIQFYPNPTTGDFTLKGPDAPYAVQILTAEGRLVKQFSNQEGEVQLSIDQLPPGIYFVRVTKKTDAGYWVERIAKI